MRSQGTASALLDLSKQRSNIYVIETDIFDSAKLGQAVARISEITSNKIDVLVHNAYSSGTNIGWNITDL
jgi:NADP-dependent 3-hydroxy acid dehydrogenase YdfG